MFSKRVWISAFSAIVLALSLSASSAFADEPVQEDKAMGDNAQAVLNGQDLRQVLGTAPTLLQRNILSSPAATVWGVRFGENMTDGQKLHGIDVSTWDGANDWATLKSSGVQFAIIRCGYGDDYTFQDDDQWIHNVRGAKENGIPFGIYIYSYATNTSMAQSEAYHVLRQLNNAANQVGIVPADVTFPIYFDFEDSSQSSLSQSQIQDIVNTFASVIKSDPTWGSLEIGHYSMRSWMEDGNRLGNLRTFNANGQTYSYSRWIAEYGGNTADTVHTLHNNSGAVISPTLYDIWQVCSQGKTVLGDGLKPDSVDIDFSYKAFPASINSSFAVITADTSAKTYTGERITPSVSSVKYGTVNSTVLSQRSDYSVSYGENVNAGTGAISIEGIGGYRDSVVRQFTINPRDIREAAIKAIPAQHYTGEAIEPDLDITYGGKSLVKGQDYDVEFSENVNVGSVIVTVTGKGNFCQSAVTMFEIEACDIAGSEIEGIPDQTWSGQQIDPVPTIVYDGQELVEGVDYSLSYSDDINVGEARINVTGLGRFAGTSTHCTYNIVARNIELAVISAIPDQIWTGEKVDPKPVVTAKGQVLTEDVDYELSYENDVNVGEATVTITGIGGYDHFQTATYNIVEQSPSPGEKTDIDQAEIGVIADQVYTGRNITPALSISYEGQDLVQNRDYEVVFDANVNVGEATATISGIGDFEGQTNVKFNIVGRDIAEATVSTISPETYTGSAISPALVIRYGGKVLSVGVDYEAEYTNNVNAGTANVNITGKGNFTSSTDKTFAISKRNVSDATIASIPDEEYTGLSHTPALSISYNGKVLEQGKDYQASYADVVQPGTGRVTVNACGNNWTGSTSTAFNIVDNHIPLTCPDVLSAGSGKLFEIEFAAKPGRYLDVEWGSLDNGGNIWIYDENKSPAQRFRAVFHKTSGNQGYYTFQSVLSGKYIDACGNGYTNGTNIWQWELNGCEAQKWVLIDPDGDGNWTIMNILSKRALCAHDTWCQANVTLFDYVPLANEQFIFHPITQTLPNGVYRIDSAVDSNYCLDVNGASRYARANIHLWPRNGCDAQSFRVIYNAHDGYYTIRNTGSNMMVDVCGAEIADATNIWQWPANGHNAQKWAFEKDGQYYVLRSALCGSALDLSAGRAVPWQNIMLWHTNGLVNQKWKFTRLY